MYELKISKDFAITISIAGIFAVGFLLVHLVFFDNFAYQEPKNYVEVVNKDSYIHDLEEVETEGSENEETEIEYISGYNSINGSEESSNGIWSMDSEQH